MDRSHSCSSSRQTQTDDVELHREVLVAFLDHLRGSGLTGDLWNYAGAARHFLFWLAQRSIPLANVDDAVVRRFAHHRCHCRNGYRPQAITNPLYLSAIRRFVRFAEDRGDISIDDDIGPMSPHLAAFADAIANLGYSDNTLQRYRSEAEHFAAWMRLSRRRWCEVDTSAVRQFALHDCHCPIRRKRARLSPPTGATRRKRGAFRLIKFLRENGTLPTDVANPTSGSEEKRLNAYCEWLTRHRGASKETIRRYTLELTRCISELGSDSTTYDVESIRNVVIREEARRSRKSAQMTATALRSYLRFLIAQGECRPELLSAVPTVRRWRLATLPRCASPDVIEHIIASCDTTTPIRIRDRAIILLLARLGLRAGDICGMRISDVDWANGKIVVHGKGRRTVRLPLPQDAGDALLAYLERIRPRVKEPRIFLRIQAPFTPFVSSAEISGIVARAIARAGIEGVPTGAHMFRHSLATSMLRQGAALESIATILRHRSPSTTAIYAKVDLSMLNKVAQPWIGGDKC